MKIFKKILASTLALFISASFVFGGFANINKQETNIAYADSAVEAQRDQLRLALNDANNVRATQSYKNAAKKDIDAYEAAISKGKALVDDKTATGEQLYQATKNIDVNRKYLPTSANIILIKEAINTAEKKLQAIDFLEKKMPNSVKRYRKVIDKAKQDSRAAINNAKAYIKKYER